VVFLVGVVVWGLWYMFVHVPVGSFSQEAEYMSGVEVRKSVPAAKPPDNNPSRGKAVEIAEGLALYGQHCAMCHGEGGDVDGGSMGIPLVGISGYLSDAEQYEVVMEGREDGGMPEFDDTLGSGKVWKILAYIDTLGE
jgi:mono/diheme cytochrome c family protein